MNTNQNSIGWQNCQNLSASTAWNIKPVALSCGIICHIRASYHSLFYSFNESPRWETDKPVSLIADLWRMHLGISHDHSLLDWLTNCNRKELQRLRYTFDTTIGVEHSVVLLMSTDYFCVYCNHIRLCICMYILFWFPEIHFSDHIYIYIYIYVSNNTRNLGAHIYHRWVTNVKLTSLFISVSQKVTTKKKWTNLQVPERLACPTRRYIMTFLLIYDIFLPAEKSKGHTSWWKYRNMYLHMPYKSLFATK